MPGADGRPTVEEIRAERERRARATRTQAAAGGDAVSVEAIRAERARRAAAPRPVGVVEDAGRSFVSGVERGVSSLLGLPGDIERLYTQGTDFLARNVNRAMGDSEEEVAANQAAAERLRRSALPNNGGVFATSEAINSTAQDLAGPQHEPQTLVGEYARTIGEFAPSVLAPGSIPTRITRTIVPAAASETAGQITEGTPYEAAARFVAGLGGGLMTEASIAANARRAAERAATPGNRALEQEFGPMTEGERSGAPRLRLEEDDMRRGIGSDRAQRTIQGFDDRRAPEIRDNVMRIATRGQEPLTEDLGAAGVTISDSLRGRLDAMRATQGDLYSRAFELAQNERVAANQVANELLDNVDAVIANEFLDVGPARGVIGRLQDQISQGQADYGTVERARQALNRQLSAALKAQDDSAAYGLGRVIDELDAFVAPRLSSEASRAVTEARGFTREMLNQFGQRTRTDLSTGHMGRADPGGRAIERVLNTDLTGEQVIDSILGGATKPSAQTLGAVRRIREINDGLVYTNRQAASGVRVPGRVKVGGQTQGERRFAADSEESRYGIELPNPELQGLREALFHRILRPLDNRNPGGLIPAQTMVTNLRRALDGPGKEITSILFTAREIDAMRRALAYMENLTPPPGAAVSGTSPAISRMISGTFDKLVGIIPGIGPVLREALENSGSTNRARQAIAPPAPLRNQRPVEQPSNIAPAVTTLSSINSANRQSPAGEAPIDTSRPILENPDGSFSTEQTITIEADGQFYNIPTIFRGQRLSEDEAVALWRRGGNPEVGVYGSLAEAERAARERSSRIGQVRAGDR